MTILFNEPPPPQLIGGEKQKPKCVDDNLTVAGSIVDCGRRFFVLPDYHIHIYEKDVACVLLIEGGGNAAIMMIMLSMTKIISYLIVNNGFLIDKLIIKKHEIAQIKLVQYMLELGLKC